LLEGEGARAVELGLLAAGLARLDRIGAVEPLQPRVGGALARFGEPDRMHRPQSHFAGAAAQHEAVDPRPRAGGGDPKIEAAAVAVHARPEILDRDRREPPDCPRHDPATNPAHKRSRHGMAEHGTRQQSEIPTNAAETQRKWRSIAGLGRLWQRRAGGGRDSSGIGPSRRSLSLGLLDGLVCSVVLSSLLPPCFIV
jgi:hypothetical protein